MRLIRGIDAAVILLSVFFAIFLIGYSQPLVIAPADGFESHGKSVLFEINRADYILIDKDPLFRSPTKYPAFEGQRISLAPGTYYWRAVGISKSPVRKLKILTRADFILTLTENSTLGLANIGNVDLSVDVYRNGSYEESVTLRAGEVREANGSKFIGGMK